MKKYKRNNDYFYASKYEKKQPQWVIVDMSGKQFKKQNGEYVEYFVKFYAEQVAKMLSTKDCIYRAVLKQGV